MTNFTSIFKSPSPQTLIIKTAIFSRLLLLSLIVIWRSLFDPYDTSSPLNPVCLSSTTLHHPPHWPRLSAALENSVVWDSVYFVRIAECGYEYEQTYAFLPLLPFFISVLSRTVLAPLVPLIGLRAVLALAGYLINNAAFVLAAVYFYRLSVVILKDSEVATRASILFCFNPASIFYSSIYTESLYSLFSLGGLYHMISGASNTAVLWFALSGFARSNGVLNAGYFCFQTMHQAYNALVLRKRFWFAVWTLVLGAFRCICIVLPFFAFQAYGYLNMCHRKSQDELRPWCEAKVPLPYNFIQSHYWGVGFLRYFQLKQLPNFLLASPILFLAVCSILHYVRLHPVLLYSLGFQVLSEEKRHSPSLAPRDTVTQPNSSQLSETFSTELQGNLRQRKLMSQAEDHFSLLEKSDKPIYRSVFIVPCILHLGFMVATAFFIMHVQVATRFLSASPPLYWFASHILASTRTSKIWRYTIWAYCIAYILLGSLLFSNFYPFT